MNGIPGSVAPPGQLYVRALYDYDADDRTSLSFRQGDIIQVITQLESGWWDGVIHGVRGWFPSNYCAVVTSPFDDGRGRVAGDSEAEESGEEFADQDLHDGANGLGLQDGARDRNQEEAAFWIPQATPDGRLFYFNTLTGESTMELPLEAPTSANETGPRDRTNIFIPEQTRPPAEMMAAGYERDDETDYASASEAEDASITRDSKASSVSVTSRGVQRASLIPVTLADLQRTSTGAGDHICPKVCHLQPRWIR
jgi:son of sevenless